MWLLWLVGPRLHPPISRLLVSCVFISSCVPLPHSLTDNLFLLLSLLHRLGALFAARLSSTVMSTATRSHSVNICTAFRGIIGDPIDDHPSIEQSSHTMSILSPLDPRVVTVSHRTCAAVSHSVIQSFSGNNKLTSSPSPHLEAPVWST